VGDARDGHIEERAARGIATIALGLLACLAQAWAQAPSAGDWPMPAKDHASTRYADLADITRDNVAQLKPAFTFSTGVLRGHEAAPIVVGATMYVVTPYPNVVYALDLATPGAPVKWKYEPKPLAASQGVACCDVVNRGVAYADGRVFLNTLDNQTIALDAASGKELWRVQLGDIRRGETMTMAPFVVADRVLVGNSGGEFGVRGWLVALDAATGREAWRAYSTGPDRDVLIGPRYKPFYAKDRGTDLGVRSWPGEAWKLGGGTVWGWLSYDAELGLVYYGTANPGPWNHAQRPGDNFWTSGLFARDARTGEAAWFYQMSPHDRFDYDGVNESLLVDLPSGAGTRKVLVHPDRNGYLYVLDRATGEIVSAPAYAHVTTSTGIDRATGRLVYAPEKEPHPGKVVRDVCPAAPGGKDWQPSAYSPRTRLVYIPRQNLCQEIEQSQASYIAGTPYVGAEVKMLPGPGGNRGEVAAWDIAQGRKAWSVAEDLPVWSGALATAGDLVFYGTLDGWFKAVDARTGALLWQYKTGSGIVGQPISYRGPDGKQYVAVLSGVGGWAGAVVAGNLDTRDKTAATGFANVVPDLKSRTSLGGMLYAFALP
jgi:PQQ-dependent dehydrogenase (methanol/ethanol family)